MPFPMEHQQEPEWCWDAVAVSIERYFNPASQQTQVQLADQVFGRPADEGWYLSNALQRLGRATRTVSGPLTFAEIQEQVKQNLPVCVEIQWDSLHFHYVVISGYRFSPTGAPQLLVSDPLLQDSNVVVWDYEAFVLAYSPSYTNAEGVWATTFLLQP